VEQNILTQVLGKPEESEMDDVQTIIDNPVARLKKLFSENPNFRTRPPL
jgi:hypothetical protein